MSPLSLILATLDRIERQNGPGQCRFATTAFTDQSDIFAAADCEGDMVDGAKMTRRPEKRAARQRIVAHHIRHLDDRLSAPVDMHRIAHRNVAGGLEQGFGVGVLHAAEQFQRVACSPPPRLPS